MRDDRLTIIESPFAGQFRDCVYLKKCLRDSWERGELPFASHGFYPLFLDEDKPAERKAGIEAGYAYYRFAKRVVFYVDHGMSPGMDQAKTLLEATLVVPFEFRTLDKFTEMPNGTGSDTRIKEDAG